MGSASHNARSRWAGATVCYGLLYACNACNAWRGAGVLVALMERVRCVGASSSRLKVSDVSDSRNLLISVISVS